MISIVDGRNDNSVNEDQTSLIQRFHEDLIIDRIVSFIDALYNDETEYPYFLELRKSIIVGIYLVGTTRDGINPEYTIYVAYNTNRIPFDKDIDNNSKYVLKNLAEAQLNSFVAEQTFKYLKDIELIISFEGVDFTNEIEDLETEKKGLKDSLQIAKSNNNRRYTQPEFMTYNDAETKIANLINGQIIDEENRLLSTLSQNNIGDALGTSNYLPYGTIKRISEKVKEKLKCHKIRNKR